MKTVLSSLIFDERKREDIPDSGHSHWAEVLAERGLKEVEAEAV